MVSADEFLRLKLELSTKAKNGLDFILAATLVWAGIAVVWWLPGTPTSKGFVTFFLGALTLPLAFLLSKVLGTHWKLAHNPLHPLGLWLNFAQLFYFPLLVFVYMRYPQHFIMTYGIITGAHFFTYAWLYHAPAFAAMAGVIAVGCLVLGLQLAPAQLYLIPAFLTGALVVLGGLLWKSYQTNLRAYQPAVALA